MQTTILILWFFLTGIVGLVPVAIRNATGGLDAVLRSGEFFLVATLVAGDAMERALTYLNRGSLFPCSGAPQEEEATAYGVLHRSECHYNALGRGEVLPKQCRPHLLDLFRFLDGSSCY